MELIKLNSSVIGYSCSEGVFLLDPFGSFLEAFKDTYKVTIGNEELSIKQLKKVVNVSDKKRGKRIPDKGSGQGSRRRKANAGTKG